MAFPPLFWQSSAGLFRTTLTWEHTFSLVVVVLLSLGFLTLLFLQWRDLHRRVTARVRVGLCVLRGVMYLLLLGMILNPTLLLQKVLRLLPALAVVIDTSGSMALLEADGRSRLQQVLNYLRGDAATPLQALREDYEIKLYQFDEAARPLPLQHLDTLSATGQTTDVIGSLSSILEEHRAAPPVGVLLLSDGTHHKSNTGLEFLRQAGVRMATVGVGNPTTYRDLRIAAVQAPTLAFLHYPVEINVTLQTWGYRGERLPVVLKQAGQVVATQMVHISTDTFEQQVQFEIVPEDIGEYTYTVSVAPRLGEALTDNNHKDFPLSVARDKIRVLLVCGSPTWNYRFLRQALKNDPSVDLISFVILRTPTDVVNVPESQLSLIPFPTQRLFTQELKNFDLIIFENFSFQFYFPWYYLENVRKYVLEGGAFAMIGGSLAFAQGGYAETPIEDILPVSLRVDRNDYRPITQRMVLTEEGKVHPITRLAADVGENQRIWDTIPELDALNMVGRLKPGATVLGVSSRHSEDGQETPLLAIQRFGKGRTLALMSDYTWKWNFHMAGRMDSNQYYLQFIRQVVRWLIRDPVLKQVRIMADGNEFPLGSEMSGTVQVLRDDYRPAAEALIRAKLRSPSGTEMQVQPVPTGNPGEFRYRLPAKEEGLYAFDVQAIIGTETHEANQLLLRAYRPGEENQQAAPNHALLREIADHTGGAFFALQDPTRPSVASLAEFFGGTPGYKVLEETRYRLRETLPLFLVVLGCLAIEWWWRRQAGLF
jgi:Putative glutamine amidotransferase